MMLQHKHIEQLFNEGLSFVDVLPYLEYIDDICLLSDGSLGKVWQINMIGVEGKTDKDLNAEILQWQNLLMRLPQKDFCSQIILKSSNNVSHRNQIYNQYREDSPERVLTFSDEDNARVMTRALEVFITVRFFPSWRKSKGVHMEEEIKVHIHSFEKHIALIEGLINATGVKATPLSSNELINFLYTLLNPKRSKNIKHCAYREEQDIRDQVLFHSPQANNRGFVLEGQQMGVISLKEMPLETSIGMFTKEFYAGGVFCLLDQSAEFMMVINLTVPSAQDALLKLKTQKDFAFMHKENWLGDSSIEVVEKKKELDDVIKEMYQGNQKIIQARFHWVVFGINEAHVDIQCDHIINALNRLQCEGMKEDLIGASLFLTCLPLNFDPYYERFIKRSRRFLSGNAADMLPVYGAYQGTKTPALKYFNRRGETVFFDMFDSNINPHGLVVGASGAGKSFFINDFILQNERLGAHFFVLDKGDSYKKLNQLLQGQYMAFDLNKPVTINPFAYDPTPENLSFLMSLLSAMASGGDERYRLTREEEGLLHQAMMRAYEKKTRDQEVFLSDITGILNSNEFNEKYGINSLMGPTLALRLTPFTKKGPYGGFFDGPNQFNIQSRFVAFELAHLSSYPDLQLAVLLNLMFFMTNFVASEGMKSKRKYLLIDEAWSLLKVKNTADFITNAFKTFRKYRCSTIAITQEIADLTRVESGIAIIANASNKIFLRQEAAVIDLLKNHLSLDDAKINVLKTIETIKGKYAEGFVINDSGCGVIRLVPSPSLYWVANSEPSNNEYLFKKVAECDGDFMKAIQMCVKEHPYGL